MNKTTTNKRTKLDEFIPFLFALFFIGLIAYNILVHGITTI